MYRSEHPNPQFMRESWENLNGKWEFEIDNQLSGEFRKLYEAGHLSGIIEVPFCPESRLSGIANTDFINAVWYRRTFTLTPDRLGGRVLIHFGAVDYKSVIYINGKEAIRHTGGFSSFSADITDYVKEGENVVTVYAKDDTRSDFQPRGKQSEKFLSSGCDYTRSTGIWQTVWLEFVPENYIKSIKLTPDTQNCSVTVEAQLVGKGEFSATAFFGSKQVGCGKKSVDTNTVILDIPLSEKHLWELGDGKLYDLSLSFGDDNVKSYFGLRSVEMDGLRFMFNGRSVFQRLVLDQGYYEDGIYTAPSDDDLIKDIRLSMDLGFNGARLHQKVFEPRFLYHCDRMGYMVWGEFPSWDLDFSDYESLYAVETEWLEIVKRDYNHPSIIGWCPINETTRTFKSFEKHDNSLALIYKLTKQLDPTRPCIDTSGYIHQQLTDIYDLHDYCQSPETLRERYKSLETEGRLEDIHVGRIRRSTSTYSGQPVFISECGGASWDPSGERAWGYGEQPKTEQEFIDRYDGIISAFLDNSRICGFCYTQLYDIEQEQNGLLKYDRTPKFPVEVFRKINQKKAKIEL